jgi:hypothetical protein
MAINSTYYLDAADLATATAVYLDSSLAFIAPDGFYADGAISRQQSAGILLSAEACSECGAPCGENISGSGNQGIYLINLETGTELGAVIISFDPDTIPDGIRATYDGNVYNTLSSVVDGPHRSTDPNGFTIVGSSGSTGTCSSWYPSGGTISLNEFIYSGISFTPTGNTQSITITTGDISLNTVPPQTCIMVIPKVNISPSIINIEAIGPCSSTVFTISAECPVLLTGFSSSVVKPSHDCFIALTETYYNVSLSNTPGVVGLYDFVYEDAYGATPLAPGFYTATGSIIGGGDYFEVDANGVVISIGFC